MRALLAACIVGLAACGSATKANVPNVVAVAAPSGRPPGASAPPACDARGEPIDAEHAEGMRIVERCVTGASPETRAALEKVLGLRADQKLTSEALRRDLEAAWATGLVDQIEATARPAGSGCVLFLAVTERPKISAVDVEGAAALKEHPSVGSFPKPGSALAVPALHAASEKLREAYVAGGWEDAKVDHVLLPDGPGRVRVKVVVSEGARATIGKVTFEGAGAGRVGDLRKAVELDEGAPLDPERLVRAVLAVAAFYYDHGFLDVKVEEPKRSRAADGTTAIAIKISEGPVFRIGKLSVKNVDPEGQKEILAGLNVRSGDVFNRSKLKADLAAIESRSRQSSKPRSAEPETKLDPKARTVDITFAIKDL